MEFIASDIKSQLDKLNALLSTKGLVENSDKFVFDKEGIFAFDGETFIATIFETDIAGAVEGETFYKLISKYGANKITIKIEGSEMVIIKGRSEARLAFDNEIECPIDLFVDDWKELPEDFIEAINIASYTTGKDYTDMRTVCIHLKEGVCESSDSYRITVFQMKEAIQDELFIPNDILTFFNRSKPIEYSLKENWVYYQDLDGTIIAHRLPTFEGKYPDLKEKISGLTDFHKIELPEKLYDSLDRAGIFLEGKFEGDKFVSITCEEGVLSLQSKNIGKAYKESMRIDFSNKVSFEINPAFLMQMMEKANVVEINDSIIKIQADKCLYVAALTA